MSNFLPKGYGTPDFWDKETAQYYENHNREEEIKNFMKKLGYGDYSDKNGSTFPQIGSETDMLKNQPSQPQVETPQVPITAPNNEEITTANFAPFPISNNQLSEQPSQTERPSVTEQVSQDNVDLLKENANKYLNQINSGNYGWIQQIAANKNSYENADQTAAMLQSQGYNVTGDNIRQKVHDNTEYLRKFANAEGIDLGAWGSAEGISNADSQFAMDRYNYNQAKTAKEKFENVQKQLREDYAQSSQQRFEELYDYYRSQHKSQRDSIILAGRETMAYAKERTGFLQNAIDEYGIDDGAILNQFGVGVLGQLATEDNIMGTAYAQAYQTPKENYNKMLEMQKARENNQAAYKRLIEKMAGDMNLAEFNQSQNNLRADKKIESAEKIAAEKNQTSKENTQLREDGLNARAEALRKLRESIAQANIVSREKIAMAKQRLSDSGNKNISDKDKKAMIDDLKIQKSVLEDQLKRAQELEDSESTTTAQALLTQLEEVEQNLLDTTNPDFNLEWNNDDTDANVMAYIMGLQKYPDRKDLYDTWVADNVAKGSPRHNFYKKVEEMRKKLKGWY